MKKLGSIKKVNLREVWAREDILYLLQLLLCFNI